MNKKYLFGMLLSGAMLTACTADDALEAAKVAKNAEIAAPVFAVTFDNDGLENRGTLGSNGTLSFEDTDLLSLFHGIKDASTSLAGWQNAIYSNDGAEGDALVFKAKVMIQEGNAVMVFPGDDAFNNDVETTNAENYGLGKAAPVIRIANPQTAETQKTTPHISPILDIKQDVSGSNKGKGQAGYNKEYELYMKRVAGTLILTLKTQGAPDLKDPTIDELTITGIEISNDNKVFTLAAPIATDTRNTNWGSGDNDKHPSWILSSKVDAAQAETDDKKESVRTNDVVDNTTATFTFLPFQTADFENGTVTVYTNYGVATFDAEAEIWGKSSNLNTEDAWNNNIKPNLFRTAGNTSVFQGEQVGGLVTTTLSIDLAELDMNNLHIKTDRELHTALAVYDALYGDQTEEDVVFVLEGDKQNKIFEVSAETYMEMIDHMNARKAAVADNPSAKGLKFKACSGSDGNGCTVVKVTNSGAAVEIPSVNFETPTVELQLTGNWKYTDVTDVSGTAGKDNKKEFTNVTKLTLLSGAVVDLKNYVAVTSTSLTNGIEIKKGANVNVNGEVILRVKTDNYGVITIASGADNELSVGGGVTLTNQPSQKKDNTSGLDKTDCGVINNGGWLDVVEADQNSTINNYGIINQTTANARTLVTNNALGATLTAPFAKSNNAIGTIVLFNKDAAGGNITVKTAATKGFIQLTVKTQAELTATGYGSVANYIILDGTCTEVKAGATTGSGAVTYLPENVEYFEVASSLNAEEIVFSCLTEDDEYSLKGLVVPAGKIVTIPETSTVEVTGDIYLKGRIIRSGTLTYTSAGFGGYFGGDEEDSKNVKANSGKQ